VTIEPLVVSGHQPCYHAYLPTVAKLVACDRFLIADDLPFSRSLFQHRQRFKVGLTDHWATVPVERSASRCAIGAKAIRPDSEWRRRHMELIRRSLGSAPHFGAIEGSLEAIYAIEWSRLIDLDLALWRQLVDWYAPTQEVLTSSQLGVPPTTGKGARIASELRMVAPHGGTYLAGVGSGYLLDAAPDGRRHVDALHDAGFSVDVVSIDSERLARHTAVPAAASGIALVAYEGPAAAEILRSAIMRLPLELSSRTSRSWGVTRASSKHSRDEHD
jgi:hypothetical protein